MKVTMFVMLGTSLLAAIPSASLAQDETPQQAVNVAGTWELTSEGMRGPITWQLTFTQDGSTLSGHAEGPRGQIELQRGSVSGSEITFTMQMGRGGRTFDMTYTGTVAGDSASGTMLTPRGDSVPWTAKRVQSPQE
jgi:hypothetical protein